MVRHEVHRIMSDARVIKEINDCSLAQKIDWETGKRKRVQCKEVRLGVDGTGGIEEPEWRETQCVGRERSELQPHAGVGDKPSTKDIGNGRKTGLGMQLLGMDRYEAMFMGSLDVKTAFDIAQPRVLEANLKNIMATLLSEMMDGG